MNKRKVCSLAGAFLLGLAAAEFRNVPLGMLGFCYGIVWICTVIKVYPKTSWKRLLLISLCPVAFCAGGIDGLYQQQFRADYEAVLESGVECLVQGEIAQKEQKKEQYLFYLGNCILQIRQKNYSCNQILVYLDTGNYSIGETICVKGRVQTFSLPGNEGNYNERQYYQSLKIDFSMEDTEILGVYGRKSLFREYLAKLKMNMQNSYQNCLGERDCGVMTAMTLGDKSRMEQELKGLYQKAGISHFYCISGLHISMLGMSLYRLLRRRGISYGAAGIVSGTVIVGYGMLTGFGISAIRAIGMFLLLIYAKFRGRSCDQLTSVSVMAALMAGQNPGLLHHAGALLSFGAVLGVILAEEVISSGKKEPEKDDVQKRGEEKWKKKWSQWIASGRETLLVSICIQLVTIPILGSFFYEISIYAVFVNLFILPCMGILLGTGLLGGMAGCISVGLGKILLLPCHWILAAFEILCSCFLKLPHAVWITGKFGMEKIFIWYGVLLFAWYFYQTCGWRKAASVSVLLICALLSVIQPEKSLELDFLDVGQGDAIYLSTGDGTSVFIDGGSSDISKVGTYRILPFLKYRGIRQVDYWFVSHCDSDHISGLFEVMESGYEIKNLVVSQEMPEDESWQELRELAEEKEICILPMKQGDRLEGRDKNNHKIWSLRCLFPGTSYQTEDRNGMSLSLLFESEGFSCLFAGDLAKEQEKILVQNGILKTDIFKASHHGSDYSNSRELLEAIQPEITVISCGLNNRYGHPGTDAVERMKDVETNIYETRYLGQIKISYNLKTDRCDVWYCYGERLIRNEQ